MAKNNIGAVKQEIQTLAIGNYKSYPEDFENKPVAPLMNIQSLAKGYWDVRGDKEIARDERLGISLEDYKEWTREAYTVFMTVNGHSMN